MLHNISRVGNDGHLENVPYIRFGGTRVPYLLGRFASAADR